MKIYDCFTYFDEDLILDIRLNTLNQYVHKFIVTEAIYIHKGVKRELKFNINNFKNFKNKIEYIVVNEIPKDIENPVDTDNNHQRNSKILINALKRENYQRNMLSKGIVKADENDLIIISDVDEIPNLEKINNLNKLNFFEQKMYYYKFNLRYKKKIWIGSRACKKKYLMSPQWLRNIKFKNYPLWRIDTFFSKKKYINVNFIKNGGWHFTNIKSPKEIHFKLSNFLHHLEYEYSGLSEKDIEKMIDNRLIYYDHDADKSEKKWKASLNLEKVDDVELPSYIVKNKELFKKWFDLK